MSSLVLHLGIKRVDKAVRGALTAQGQLRAEARATTEVGGNRQVGGVAGGVLVLELVGVVQLVVAPDGDLHPVLAGNGVAVLILLLRMGTPGVLRGACKKTL